MAQKQKEKKFFKVGDQVMCPFPEEEEAESLGTVILRR
jgi:hypothetical protein